MLFRVIRLEALAIGGRLTHERGTRDMGIWGRKLFFFAVCEVAKGHVLPCGARAVSFMVRVTAMSQPYTVAYRYTSGADVRSTTAVHPCVPVPFWYQYGRSTAML